MSNFFDFLEGKKICQFVLSITIFYRKKVNIFSNKIFDLLRFKRILGFQKSYLEQRVGIPTARQIGTKRVWKATLQLFARVQ